MESTVTIKQYRHLPPLPSPPLRVHMDQMMMRRRSPLRQGKVVAIIGDNSTATAPQITFGRVIKVVDRDYAIISTFEEVSKDTFAFKIGAKERVKLKEIVTPIDMVYQPSKNTYSLRTPKTDIHLSRRPL